MTIDPIPPPIRNMGPYKVAEDLYLSAFDPQDTPEMHRVLNINNTIALGMYSESLTFPQPLEEAQAFTQYLLAQRTECGFVDTWAIRPSPSGPVIGLLYLGDLDHEEDGLPICYRPPSAGSNAGGEQGGNLMRCGVLGFWLSPEFAGKGVMTRVVTYALRELAGPVFSHERVHGMAWEENTPSNRVMERAGMVRSPSYPLYVPKFKVIKTCSHYTFDIKS
ncbi:hypothetical protein BGZ92_010096 [Podila epicladia]|nr:hypothetical protein BGZ92_010096 [Podila epicladia]